MNYALLEKVICETIKEEQIKLGYEKETIRLYYPMGSLANILEEEISDTNMLENALNEFVGTVEDKLGRVQITHKDGRFCLIIPPQGADYVHENYDDNPFLREFIGEVRKHDCTLEKLIHVFQSYSDQVLCEKSNNDEFDYIIYYTDPAMEDYRYCIKFDHGHTMYHRFSKKDYELL